VKVTDATFSGDRKLGNAQVIDNWAMLQAVLETDRDLESLGYRMSLNRLILEGQVQSLGSMNTQ